MSVMEAGIVVVEGERKQEDRASGINWGRIWERAFMNQPMVPSQG